MPGSSSGAVGWCTLYGYGELTEYALHTALSPLEAAAPQQHARSCLLMTNRTTLQASLEVQGSKATPRTGKLEGGPNHVRAMHTLNSDSRPNALCPKQAAQGLEVTEQGFWAIP
jgi:hypothetical protein